VTRRDVVFVACAWFASRLIVVGAMIASNPATFGWEAFVQFDGTYYRRIATVGYEYARDGGHHAVAFYPLYALIVGVLVRLGIPFAVGAVLVSNAAFAALLPLVFSWARERFGVVVARWAVGVLCFVPLSLFCSVAYAEALFLLLTVLAFRDFDRRAYARAALWTALASATRFPGLGLAFAFVAAAVVERRTVAAYATAAAGLVGTAALMLACRVQFGDALAPFRTEAAWRSGLGFALHPWAAILSSGTNTGPAGLERWPYQLAIAALWLRLAHVRKRAAPAAAAVVVFALTAAEFALWSDNRMTVLLVLFGGGLLFVVRERLGPALFAYGLFGLALIFGSGVPISAERIAYGILPFALALALLFERAPLFGGSTLVLCAADLATDAAAFSRAVWTA